MPKDRVVLEIIGEGRTEFGDDPEVGPPEKGVLPILVHKLCGKPPQMLVKRRSFAVLEGKGLAKKVQFAKRQARQNQSDGAVFVLDTEGNMKERVEAMTEGRDREQPDYPMAIGVAHPCIEAWLLADPTAIRRGLNLSNTPTIPDEPENLPAPCKNHRHNPKTVLAALGESRQKEISTESKDNIAKSMSNMTLVRERCPRGFAPFADEVETHIRPLF